MTLEAKLLAVTDKVVADKAIVGNTIEVWLDVPRSSDQAIVFGVDAPWRIVGPENVLHTSADIPWDLDPGESEADYEARLRAAWSKSDFLVGRRLRGAFCDSTTGDLCLDFGDGVVLQSFTVWTDEPPWSLRLYAENRRVGPGLDRPIKRLA